MRPKGKAAVWIGVGLVVGAALAGGISWAAIPGSDGVISGCVVKPGLKQAGKLRVIDAEAGHSCKATENPLNWNQAGAPATRLWAAVDVLGNLVRGSGAVSAHKWTPGTGQYEVIFDRNVTHCAYLVSIAGDVGYPAAAAAARSSDPSGAGVNVFTGGVGTLDDRPFHLAVFC